MLFDFTTKSKSVTEVQSRFRRHFNVDRQGQVPSRSTMVTWLSKLDETDSVCER